MLCNRRKCCSRLLRRTALSAVCAPGFARTTKSQAGNARRRRKVSRARRLSRLRSTARFAARREIVRPRRACARPLGLPRMVKKRSVERAGSAKTRPNSAAVCRRCRGEKPACDTSNAVPNRCSLRRQARATFRAAARQDLAAVGRSHAGAEAVGALAVQIARLKSAFHTGIPRERKSSWENKRMYVKGSGELYAGPRIGVNKVARNSSLWELWITVAKAY